MTETQNHDFDASDKLGDNGDVGSEGHPPRPASVAKPTYWPLVLAVGITSFAWGWVTSLLLTGLGLILIIASIVNWIGDIRHDRGYEHTEN